jgi:hypothetical protein
VARSRDRIAPTRFEMTNELAYAIAALAIAAGAAHAQAQRPRPDRGVARKIMNLVPDYMVMGERGMADMGEMEMPLPDNTLPMMTGQGPFGPDRDGWHVHRGQGA